MAQQDDYFAEVYRALNSWLNKVKVEQKPRINELMAQAKLYAVALEHMSEEKLQQFSDNLKYDLYDFYQLNRKQAQDSLYLTLLNEALWENLAGLTDKAQVEWFELIDDFSHDGVYRQGDIIGFGELACNECDEVVHITHRSEVQVCSHCGHDTFTRVPLKP
ncbi:zinc ribbon-containing protein [Colwellia sp. D2M02]|uniref:Zinc ribbon-containing protein n=1 Tax=Colwellia asteriadis TaxID=517723 RepID=A0ABN1LAA3_9GAMM|nr:zinc ribbon-containing protein [Colwellia sp. D2M02]MBU2892674.1 zinc ribbon-containing protein [Colwellia sp. D2M02]